MPSLRRQPTDIDTPAQLAAEHSRAKAEYENRRQNVIDRGTAKVESLRQLEAEVATERAAHEALLTQL